MINHNENEDENEKQIKFINRPPSLDMGTNIVNKKVLSTMMLLCIKKHLSNIWSSVHEKVKQHWGWVEKKCYL